MLKEGESAKQCPICGKLRFSHSIQRGCFQYWCCNQSFEGSIVSVPDLTICDYYDYTD